VSSLDSDVAGRLARAARVTVLTGAGVSAASGVPTFRGAGGLWRRYRAEDLATAEAFARNPSLVWEWYAWRRGLVAACAPNEAHAILARWHARFPRFTLVTQNVDGLHERAGSADAIRLHGSLWELACWDGCAAAPRPWHDNRVPLPELPPHCPACGGLARPAVVWFGEMLDPTVVERATAALSCDVFLSIGTSSVVYPAAGFLHGAKSRGVFTVEINPEETPMSADVDAVLRGGAEDVLPKLEELLARSR
jgi:NAD-dependent deacetylase